jgi:hypothetical protein
MGVDCGGAGGRVGAGDALRWSAGVGSRATHWAGPPANGTWVARGGLRWSASEGSRER